MTTKQFIHGAGLVTAAVLGTLSQFPAAVQSPYMRAALGALAVLSALFTNLDKLGGAVPPALLLLLALPLLHGCAWLQKPATQKVVRCTGAVLATCKADLVPLLACLDVSDPTMCVLAVGNAAGCAGKEALACRVREAAAPSVMLTFTFGKATNFSPDDIDKAAVRRREDNENRVYVDLGVYPVAP